MTRFPLLEQLRAERERLEAEASAPVRARLSECQDRAARLAASLRTLERMIGSEIGKHVVERIGHEVGRVLRIEIVKALGSINASKPGLFTLTLPTDALRFMDPQSIEREVLARFAEETAPQMSMCVDETTPVNASVTVLDIRIPELGYRHAMADLH